MGVHRVSSSSSGGGRSGSFGTAPVFTALAVCSHVQVLSEPRSADLTLPAVFGCEVGDAIADLPAAIQRLTKWSLAASAHETADMPTDAAIARECVLGSLAQMAERGSSEDDELLLLMATSPGLLLLADLGRIAGFSHDLALDPWLRSHCRHTFSEGPSAWCSGMRFGEAVRSQQLYWSTLGSSLYRNLQPSLPGPVSRLCPGLRRDETIAISVVGSHSGLSTAAAAALSAALREYGQNMELAYFGHWAWCQNVDNCEEPLAQIFRAYQQDWAETDAEENAEKFEIMVEQWRRLFGRSEPYRLLASEMLLCTRPFLFCWLLRGLWPDGWAQLPMLHYYSGPLLFDTPSGAKEQVLMAFRRTVLLSDLDLVVSSSALQSAWMLAMAGVAVPHVRPHAAQLRGLYTPPAKNTNRMRAIVLRSTWINSLIGESFRAVLARLLSGSSLDGRLSIDWLLSGKFLQYEEIAEFHAAVFLPEQPDKLTFWEQYEMNMPLWLPTADFWVRIHAIGEHRYSVFAHLWEAELPEGRKATAACGVPAPLFFQGSSLDELRMDTPLAAALWFHLTDYAIFPHLQLFDSAAALVRLLLAADLGAISQHMSVFNARTWQASSAFYRTALCVLSLSKAAAGQQRSPLTPKFAPQPGSSAEWARVCSS